MAYNEIRTINNIQLEDIKARQSIQELDNKKANKSDIVNGLNFKGTTTYSALPTSDNSVGDFYYVTDGDGTNGEGNYAWNGTAWYFSGKTTDFGDISTKANAAVNNVAFKEGKLKVTKNDGTSTETEVIDSSLTKSGKAADAKITGDEIGQLKEDLVNTNNFDAVVIFKDSKLPNVTDSGFTVVGSSGFYLTNLSNQYRIEYNFSDIASELPDVTTWNESTKTFTLTLGSEQQFGVDLLTGKVQTASITKKRSASFLSLYWVYYRQYGGKIFEDCASHSAELVEPMSKEVQLLNKRDFDVILTTFTTITQADYNGFTLSGDDKLYIANFNNKGRTTYMFEDIATELGATYASWDAENKTFRVILNGGEKRFGFNLDSMSFEVQNTLGDRPDNFVVLYWVYYKRYGGKILESYAATEYNDKKESYLLSDEFQREDFNASYHTGAKDFYTVCKRYSSLFNGDEINDVVAVNQCEAFLWFTDPHLFTAHTEIGSEPMMEEYVSQIQKYYNSTPTSFVLCGGDWLGNSDTPDMACYKMGYINGICKSMFDKLYMLVGNHDTNYQGKRDANSERYTTRLSRVAIRNLWYRDTGRSYYDFKGVNTHFYCFDTGIENQALTYDNNYGYEQAAWFAENLTKERFDHVAIAVHIYSYRTIPTGAVPDDVQPLTRLLLQISSAYNRRSEISVNGKNYNFADATGRVEFMLAGHSHADYTLVDSGIPIIATLDCGNHQSYKADCSFDLVFVDYDNRKIKCIRAGVGEDREMNLDN